MPERLRRGAADLLHHEVRMNFELRIGMGGILQAVVLGSLLCGGAFAGTLPTPQSDILLTVEGDIANTNSEGRAEFDMALLQTLPTVTIRTNTIWTEGVQEFRGVQLSDLLEAVGAQGDMIYATAVNDYAIEIPVTDGVDGGPIIAYQQNGQQMSVRTQGPLWLVYPYDAKADYQSEVIYSRSIWQLVRMEITD